MAEASVTPEASVASVGPDIRYIGQHIYAYSGDVIVVPASTATTTMLDFTTGAGYIVATYAFTGQNTGSNDEFLNIILNDLAIFRGRYPSGSARITEQPVQILIPPFTKVECKLGVETTQQSMTLMLVGRVYGAE